MLTMKVFNFFKMGDHYEYIKDQKVVRLSADQMACMTRQYKIMGYMKVEDNDLCVSFAKDENEVKNFLEKLSKKY